MVKKMMKIVGIVFLVLLIVGIGILVYLCYQNLHWWEKDMKQIEPYLKRNGVGNNRQPMPNICEFIIKSRYGIYGDKRLKLWSYFDRGTFQRHDYFVTDDENNVLADIRPTELEDF